MTLLLKHRRLLAEAIHALLAALALAAGFWLRFEFTLEPVYRHMLTVALPLLVGTKWMVFRAFSLRDLAWRFLGFRDLLRVAAANLAAVLAATVVLRLAIGSAFPRSIHILDGVLCLMLMIAARAGLRVAFDLRQAAFHSRPRAGEEARHGIRDSTTDGNQAGGLSSFRPSARRIAAGPPRRVLIYGAGQAGVRLLDEIAASPHLGYRVVGLIDDDREKRNLRIHGGRVLGLGADLAAIARKHGVDEVLIAVASASGRELATILETCRAAGVTPKKIPALSELMESRVLVDQIREVRLEDLLGRRPVVLDESGLRARLAPRVILVTGAGGSIGSELCRQIARFGPVALIGFDHAETALYQIDQEIRERFPEVTFIPEVGSIRNRRRVAEVFLEHRPQSVYHAAAYKHVPMMEAHLFEAIENNVFGTRNVAEAAARSGAEDFVLVSSDKAVRPANVMGATKRLSELVCLSFHEHSGNSTRDRAKSRYSATSGNGAPGNRTEFMAVRFGNVLGSSGSVIPLFQRQIAAGGPVTVTHPEMRRFFMTIPEAAQLVLQAGAMGAGGEIFVLEMGDPVRIVDLARNLVLLSGLQPDQDIRIEFSGIRPGEKLYEEVSAMEEDTVATRHSQIRIFSGRNLSSQALSEGLDQLRWRMDSRDADGVVLALKEMVPDYNPSGFVLGRALKKSPGREKVRSVVA
jgi:FlaA1/EpsC-like NDP-sugar epimerase